MFGFNKKKKETERLKKEQEVNKKQKYFDKLVMGMVLGGAIGSVLGLGLAPKKGKETREIIAKKSTEIFNEIKGGVQEMANKKENRGIFQKINDKIRGKQKFKEKVQHPLKKIPNEIE